MISGNVHVWPLTRDPTRLDPDAFWPGDPTRSLSATCFELRDYFDDSVLQVNAFRQKSGLCSTHTDNENFQYKCNIQYWRNSPVADKPRDAFRGQSRSPNMVPCMAKRGLWFSWSHCLCLHCFRRLKLHYAKTHKHTNKRIFICNFSYFWAAYTSLWFFRFCKTTDFATISHFNLDTFMTLCWKLHACNHKCTIVHFLTATLNCGTLPRRFRLGIVLAGRCNHPTTC